MLQDVGVSGFQVGLQQAFEMSSIETIKKYTFTIILKKNFMLNKNIFEVFFA